MYWLKMLAICVITFSPGTLLLEYVEVSGLTALPLYWGGMIYGVYMERTRHTVTGFGT